MTATLLFGSINDSHESAYDALRPPVRHLSGGDAPLSLSVTQFIQSYLSWSTLWFLLLCIFVAFNHKNMPFMWHMRIVNAFRFVCRSQRPRVSLGPSHIFQPLITSSRAQLMEIDFNLHKTNSSYFSDLDIARGHLICTLFSEAIAYMRGGTAAWSGGASKKPMFGLALGATSCSFKKEIKPYEEYEMWSKILSWDEKWIYIATHFVRKGAAKPRSYSLYPQQNRDAASEEETYDETAIDTNKAIYATAVSKCVFKSGRKTVAPELMMQIAGLLPTFSSGGADEKRSAGELDEVSRTLLKVEQQRQQGLKTAQILATESQAAVEAEFHGNDTDVSLGRHSDGSGVAGVVSTLLQLAHLRRSQVL
ncbi:hypothetical protein PG993_006108 [Apiospora rasikravindrae]|uniref:Capsule polysaccharide biosynthesis protein n=1 Tax=Apiospora rasikravindrae TaxID=990691 RepID=A0ABR1TAN9_9PEZI